MSKLAHSSQKHMDEIERKRRAEDGETSVQCPRCDEWLVKGNEPDGCRDPACPMGIALAWRIP